MRVDLERAEKKRRASGVHIPRNGVSEAWMLPSCLLYHVEMLIWNTLLYGVGKASK